ncbi:alpha/beta hydrolase [Bombilactobacillus bombi]|uniref:Alpha/beta hydrolase n=1 Tax=Bombilactobacillus bombi TaxID=1303590 RepID=A0A3R6ZEJ1_9LACO|nr:alpha/beta hydrolase [Bombilactobacillus bombi]RHW52124.1 alpha/beta hydrolase [Bombilactobacillus bombi]
MKKFFKRLLIFLVIVLILADFGGAYYLFNFAFSKTGFSAKNNNRPLTNSEVWAKNQQQTTWNQTSSQDGLHLKARYYPAASPTNKTMVMIHGFGDNSITLGPYIRLFHQAGYNVLAPDNRAHGRSEGKYIGFGWLDRQDIQDWMHQLIQRQGPHTQIGLFGVSMGASTVMYYLGMKVPHQVKVAIADCGYASINGELTYELKTMFNLPSVPLIPTANLYAKTLAHYSLYDGDTAKTLKHNRVPLFIIHGANDHFVPTKNGRLNYQNDAGPKKLWLVKGAKHAQSYQKQPHQYQQKVLTWTAKYIN